MKNLLRIAAYILLAITSHAELVVREIMYNPVGGTDLEFIEIQNTGTNTVDLEEHFINDAIDYTFLVSYLLAPGEFVVLVTDEAAFAAAYPAVTNIAPGSYSGKLKNEGEKLTLKNGNGVVLFSVTYSHLAPWPDEANGNGSSLVLLNPNDEEDDYRNWAASIELHGSPGSAGDSLVKDIVINEVLSHTDAPYEDAIELLNTTTNTIDIGGWFFSDANLIRNKYRIPDNTEIGPGDYAVFYEYQFNDTNGLGTAFALSSNGDQVYLTEADSGGNLIRTADFVKFGDTENGSSLGRYPNGSGALTRLISPTFGSANPPADTNAFRAGTGALNTGPDIGPVVINEIMYHPPEISNTVDNTIDEYVELVNITTNPVSLFHPDVTTNTWRLADGVQYNFPTNTILQPGETVLVVGTNNVATFRTTYSIDPGIRIFGPWAGKLDNSRETVKLQKPDAPNLDGTVPYITIDRVDYLDKSPWPGDADGLGPSLERAPNPSFAGNPDNWQDSPIGGTPGAANSAFLPAGAIVINEFMASNISTLPDEDADFSDWIELYNTTGNDIDLSGWHLTDNAGLLTQWTFPAGVIIGAEDYLLIFASGKNRRVNGGELHTNFRLNENGEYLALVRRNGTSIMAQFGPVFPPQYDDISYGTADSGAFDVTWVNPASAASILVPTNDAVDAIWRELNFVETNWISGTAAIGYDEGPTYFPYFDTDLFDLMFSNNVSSYMRIPFEVTDLNNITQLTLGMRYDDGFVAYLNGTPIAMRNEPGTLDWDAGATQTHDDEDAVVFEDIDILSFLGDMNIGSNLLAIHGLNAGLTSSDFLISPRLVGRFDTGSGNAVQLYFNQSTPANGNGDGHKKVAPAPILSHPSAVFGATFQLTITEPSGLADIYFTLDGSNPTTNSTLYTSAITIDDNVELRARSFIANHVASPLVSAIYRTSFLGINELMANNDRTIAEMFDFSDFADWIELYNDSTTEVDIGGYHLSDDLQNRFKWQFPSGTTIPAKGHLLIWADQEDEVPGVTIKRPFYPYNNFVTRNYHTNFKLSSSGEEVGLFSPSGATVDTVVYGVQSPDVSFARINDGDPLWVYQGEATPGATNTLAGTLFVNDVFAPVPDFSEEGQFSTNAVTVAITTPSPTATIYYTLDSSEPTSDDLVYTNALTISATTVVRARVYDTGVHPGRSVTHTYFINEPEYDLPVMILTGDPLHLFDDDLGIYENGYKQREIPMHLEFYENNEKIFSVGAGGKVFGLNIFRFAQKPFSLFFREKWGAEAIEYQLFPDSPVSTFTSLVMRNSGDDWPETGFRDAFMQELVRGRIDNGIQTYKPCATYLNGEYFGMLNMRQKLDESFIEANYKEAAVGFDYYEMEGGGGGAVEQLVEGSSDEWLGLRSYVANNNLSNQANFDYVASKVDIEDIATFVIGQTFIQNTSWFHNRKWWKSHAPGGKFRWMFFDLDRGYDNGKVTGNELSDLANNFTPFEELLENDAYEDYFVQKYAAHLSTTFKSDRMLAMIDQFEQRVESTMPSHIARWGSQGGISSMTSWRNEIESMRNFARNRPANMVNLVISTFGLSGSSELILHQEGNGSGAVLANHVDLNPGTSTNVFFNDVPVEFTAVPEIGHTFSHWITSGGFSTNIVEDGDTWVYLDDNSNQSTNSWQSVGFPTNGWKTGVSKFGYGESDIVTQIDWGSDNNNRYITTYFRKEFVLNSGTPESLDISMVRDDGAIVYLNGIEQFRTKMPNGPVDNTTLADELASSANDERTWLPFTLNPSDLVNGTNVIAVEIHQYEADTPDMGFNLTMTASYPSTTTSTNFNSVITVVPTGSTTLRAVFEPDLTAHVLCGPFTNNTNLVAANSPYLVSCDLIVPSNITVIVEAGVELHMVDDASIYVYGDLLVLGTEALPCAIIPNPADNARRPLYIDHAINAFAIPEWGGLAAHVATSPLHLQHLKIRGASQAADALNQKAAISAFQTDTFMDHIDIDDSGFPIFIQEGKSHRIQNSKIHTTVVSDYINVKRADFAIIENTDFRGDSAPDTDAIDYDGLGTGIVRNCIIHDFVGFNSDAIDAGEQARNILVESNLIYNCTDKGVSVGQGSEVVVRKNLILNVDMGVGIKDENSYAFIDQNTIHNARLGVAVFEKNFGAGGGMADVQNTIFSGSTNAGFFVDSLSTINIRYSMSDTEILPGVSNLFANPYFTDLTATNFTLQRSSQAINSGDHTSPLDSDGSRADMGAFEADTSKGYVVISEIHYNPSSGQGQDSQYEFLELYNPGPSPVTLDGYHFSRGLDFSFPPGSSIASKEYIVIAADQDTYSGMGFQVFEYGTNTTLNNAGEAIELSDANTNQVDFVAYNDDPPWPLTPDGFGPSLSLIHHWLDNALHTSWWPSYRVGGSPGKRFDNLAPNIGVQLMPSAQTALMVPSIPGLRYVVEFTEELIPPDWQPLGPPILSNGSPIMFMDPNNADGVKRFYRVKALLR